MPTWTLVPALVALALLALVPEASAGWVIDQVLEGGGEGRQQILVQANRMKTVVLEPDGTPATAVIVDLDADTLTHVDYHQRAYTRATIREYVDTIRGAQQSARGQMAETMKQMEAAMKDMPPEQRRMMEQMMRQQMGQAGGGQQDCPEAKVEVRPTTQTATIAGFPATRHDVVTDGRPDSQVWLARGLTAWRELDAGKLERFTREMASLAACVPGAGGPGAAASLRAMTEGYPVRTVAGSGVTLEVVKAARRTIPATEFQPPPGFARKPLGETAPR